ncbi:hypothetical protein MTO96_000993 [Rhipicephalus appendiculatus]
MSPGLSCETAAAAAKANSRAASLDIGHLPASSTRYRLITKCICCVANETRFESERLERCFGAVSVGSETCLPATARR